MKMSLQFTTANHGGQLLPLNLKKILYMFLFKINRRFQLLIGIYYHMYLIIRLLKVNQYFLQKELIIQRI